MHHLCNRLSFYHGFVHGLCKNLVTSDGEFIKGDIYKCLPSFTTMPFAYDDLIFCVARMLHVVEILRKEVTQDMELR